MMDHLRHVESMAARDRRYARWITDVEPALLAAAPCLEGARSADGPLISIVVPTYKTPESYLRQCIESVLAQCYTNWELCIVDDGSADGKQSPVKIAREYAQRDGRIQVQQRDERGGISRATNDALGMARGELVAFVDHDDVLHPKAMGIVAAALVRNDEIDVLYTDEDKIDDDGRRHTPAFKPGLSPHHLMTSNYICHLLVARTALVRAVGGLRSEFDGAQDYDLILRLVDQARHVEHVPSVLYHWRSHAGSTSSASGSKGFAAQAGRAALDDWSGAQGLNAKIEHRGQTLCYQIRPEVTLEEQVDLIALDRPISREMPELIAHAVRHSRWCLLMKTGLQFDSDNWIQRIIEAALMPGTGAVGATIVDEAGVVAESGWFIDVQGRPVARHAGAAVSRPGYFWSLRQNRNVSFVRPTFMLVQWSAIDAAMKSVQRVDDSTPWYARLCRELRRRGQHIQITGDFCAQRNRNHPANPGESDWYGEYDGLLNPNLMMIEPDYIGAPTNMTHTAGTGKQACAALPV